MKNLIKKTAKDCVIIFFIALAVLFLYGVIHESTHWTACEIVGLNGTIEIDVFQDPPLYKADCSGINQKGNFQKFLFWGSPYLVSLLFMLGFLFYLNKKKLYLVAFPFGIVFNDAMNLGGLYKCINGTGNLANDLLNILYKTPKLYFIILILIIVLTFSLFILILILFYKNQQLSLKTLKNYKE